LPGFGGVPAEHYARASRAADAILYDGYLIRPASRRGVANQRPRRAGVLAPRPWAAGNLPFDTGVDGSVESFFSRTEVVAECPPDTQLTVRLRFLQPQRRSLERYLPGTGFVPTSQLDVDGWRVTSADEAIPQERDVRVAVESLLREPVEAGFDAIETTELETVRDATGAVRGRIRRICRPLRIRLQLAAVDAGLVVPMVRLRCLVENVTPSLSVDASPADAALHSLVSAHLILALSDGGFASLLDPPPWAADAAADCTNIHAFPVLVGEAGRDDLMLSAPVELPDYPRAEPLTLGDALDAAGATPTAGTLPTPITPATYPTGPLPSAADSSPQPHWVVVRSTA
jgi:hypothetical protein